VEVKKPLSVKTSTLVDFYNVLSAFGLVFFLALRLTSAQDGSDRPAFYALVGIGIAYSFYLFFYTLFPLTINKSDGAPRINAMLLAKLAAPIIFLGIANYVPV